MTIKETKPKPRWIMFRPEAPPSGLSVIVFAAMPVVRVGLAQILAASDPTASIDAVGTWDEAMAGAQAQPDVLLMAVDPRELTELPERLRVLAGEVGVNVLVLSPLAEPEHVRGLFAAGARGFAPLSATEGDLLAAVTHVSAGGPYIHPRLGAQLLRPSRSRFEEALHSLSDRERDIIRLVTLGNTQREIARLLSISVRTVETHMKHIRQKLDIESRAELIQHAIAANLFPTNPGAEPFHFG